MKDSLSCHSPDITQQAFQYHAFLPDLLHTHKTRLFLTTAMPDSSVADLLPRGSYNKQQRKAQPPVSFDKVLQASAASAPTCYHPSAAIADAQVQ
jgi:hypothetical protein